MAFAHAYGTCPSCKGWGALWSRTILVKRFWLFGPMVPHKVYRCDECDALAASKAEQPKTGVHSVDQLGESNAKV